MNVSDRELNQVFICYRREVSSWVAARIYDSMVEKFGRNVVFKDIDSIPLGINFREHIDSVIQECSVFLVIIHDRWMGQGELGTRRIDDANDGVRVEIESALQRNIPVIPLFIENTVMPSREDLPPPLQALADLNGLPVNNDPYFHKDMARLIYHLEPTIRFTGRSTKTLRALATWQVGFIALLLAAIIVVAIALKVGWLK